MEFLVDANVLCRLVRADDPQHSVARRAIEFLIQAGDTLVVTPQVEREFWAVATRPREQNGLGLSINAAAGHLASFERFASFKSDLPSVHENWRRLVVHHQVAGKKVHDAGHVAAMLTHQIRAILTFDSDDFRRYDAFIIVRGPEQIVQERMGADESDHTEQP